MSSIFLLQFEQSESAQIDIPSEDAASVLARIDESNWLHPNNKKQWIPASLSSLSALPSDHLAQYIPVGSIKFVEEVLRLAHNIPHLTPIGIPAELLSHPEWLERKIVFADSIQEAPKIFSDLNTERLFIKSADHVKTDFTDIYSRKNTLPTTTDSVMFSEEIPIVSEWRAFVFRQSLADIRHYSGDPWLIPDKFTLLSMIDALGQKYPAYTLDAAVISRENSFRTVVIEVHNFISCGTYGAVLPLGMYVSAYHFELQRWIKPNEQKNLK